MSVLDEGPLATNDQQSLLSPLDRNEGNRNNNDDDDDDDDGEHYYHHYQQQLLHPQLQQQQQQQDDQSLFHYSSDDESSCLSDAYFLPTSTTNTAAAASNQLLYNPPLSPPLSYSPSSLESNTHQWLLPSRWHDNERQQAGEDDDEEDPLAPSTSTTAANWQRQTTYGSIQHHAQSDRSLSSQESPFSSFRKSAIQGPITEDDRAESLSSPTLQHRKQPLWSPPPERIANQQQQQQQQQQHRQQQQQQHRQQQPPSDQPSESQQHAESQQPQQPQQQQQQLYTNSPPQQQPQQQSQQQQQQSPLSPNTTNTSPSSASNSESHRRRRILRKQQREQAAREITVGKVRGRFQQEDGWKDWAWAIVFWIQLLVVIVFAVRYAAKVWVGQHQPQSLEQPDYQQQWTVHTNATVWPESPQPPHHDDVFFPTFVGGTSSSSTSSTTATTTTTTTTTTSTVVSYNNHTLPSNITTNVRIFLLLCAATSLYALLLSFLLLGLLLLLIQHMIQTLLISSILTSCLLWGLVGGIIQPGGLIPWMGVLLVFLTAVYTTWVWVRVPVASANLQTAVHAVRAVTTVPQNTAVLTMLLLVSILWCMAWGLGIMGMVDLLDDQQTSSESPLTYFAVYVACLWSFCWTNTIIKNVLQSVVAAAVSSWWSTAEAAVSLNNDSPTGVVRTLGRSLTSSFGSICLGSLVIGPVQLWNFVWCQCCRRGTDSSGALPHQHQHQHHHHPHSHHPYHGHNRQPPSIPVRSCNRWSIPYIGLYAYPFWEAGDRALQLFEAREWIPIVTENLIQNSLVVACLVISGCCGTFGVLLTRFGGYTLWNHDKPIVPAYLIGSVMGLVLSSVILLGVVESAVNTVLICFAANPFDFHKNHPRLSQEMRARWTPQTWEPTAALSGANSTSPVAAAAAAIPTNNGISPTTIV